MRINVGFMTCGDRCEVTMFGKVICFVTVLLSYVVLRLLCCMFLGYVVLCYSMSKLWSLGDVLLCYVRLQLAMVWYDVTWYDMIECIKLTKVLDTLQRTSHPWEIPSPRSRRQSQLSQRANRMLRNQHLQLISRNFWVPTPSLCLLPHHLWHRPGVASWEPFWALAAWRCW